MIAYHIDRFNVLKPEQIINLNTNIKLDNIFDSYENSFSNHGLQFLNQYSDSAVWELCLEFIRLNFFPSLPSRLQSFFGVRTYKQALVWKGYSLNQSNSRISICKIKASSFDEFDARWITNPPNISSSESNYDFNNRSIAKMFQYSYKYWNKEFSPDPMPELLISTPVKILEIL